MDLLGPWHLLIVAAIFVLLFGAKRLPDAARSLGRSARILKSELKDGHEPAPVTAAAKTVEPAVVSTPLDPTRESPVSEPVRP